jgi:hypothetical protein
VSAPTSAVIPAGLAGGYPLVPSLYQVDTPSGQCIEVLGQPERDFYASQREAYMTQNKFTNASDLLDLDRLLFLELLIYRATNWLGRGQDYDGMALSDREEVAQRRSLKENSTLISVIKNDLGLTRNQRDRAAYESVGTYITLLKQRAKEFGVHRERQLATSITLCKQLFAILGAYDRSDEAERHKIGFEDADEILDWVREVMYPEFEQVDQHFITNVQRYWTTS